MNLDLYDDLLVFFRFPLYFYIDPYDPARVDEIGIQIVDFEGQIRSDARYVPAPVHDSILDESVFCWGARAQLVGVHGVKADALRHIFIGILAMCVRRHEFSLFGR